MFKIFNETQQLMPTNLKVVIPHFVGRLVTSPINIRQGLKRTNALTYFDLAEVKKSLSSFEILNIFGLTFQH
jgi:hypothetical protein